MTKKSFIFLVLLVMGGLLFALGMCMCLLPEWNAFAPGVAVTALGALVLLAIALTRWIMAGKPAAKIDWKMFGKVAYCIISVLVLGAGMDNRHHIAMRGCRYTAPPITSTGSVVCRFYRLSIAKLYDLR